MRKFPEHKWCQIVDGGGRVFKCTPRVTGRQNWLFNIEIVEGQKWTPLWVPAKEMAYWEGRVALSKRMVKKLYAVAGIDV